MLSSVYLLILNGAMLMACAVFFHVEQPLLLTALMLFLPLLDRNFRNLNFKTGKDLLYIRLTIASLIALLVLVNPSQLVTLAGIVFFIALPEEWFFRGYMQRLLQLILFKKNTFLRIPAGWSANIITSFLFTLLHLPSQGITGVSVFIPSLILGWLYNIKRDIIVVIFMHSLFNLLFIIYIKPLFYS